MPENIPNKEIFVQAYEGQPPWDIGSAQPAFIDAADQIQGSILDAGCGTGENALYFAGRGHKVIGIDFLEFPIREAQRKAQERGVTATFLVIDALHLNSLPEVFDTVIDCGLFHVFSDADRERYASGLAGIVKPGGRLYLMCFSDQEPPGDGPRRISRKDIQTTFASGWQIESITESRFAVRPDLEGIEFSEGGPIAWFCIITRTKSH